jgi:hypothetical protein
MKSIYPLFYMISICLSAFFRKKRVLLAIQMLCLIFINSNAHSQTLDWSSSFASAWSDGATSRTANDVGSADLDVTVNITNSQAGTFRQVTTGVNAPAVNTDHGRSNFFILAGTTDALEIDVDWGSNTAHVDVVYTFTKPVYNVAFRVGDIDKASNNSTSYFDRVTVTGKNGATNVLPQTITAVNSTGNFIVISGNSVYANPTSGVGGNANTNSANTSSQQGTANISFGPQGVTEVTVTYDNYPTAQANPALQAIAIGNMTWLTAPLPVDLISFVGTPVGNDAVFKWKVENQENFDRYEIEYSPLDSNHYTAIGKVYSNNQTAGSYEFTHANANVSGNTGLYRLKMIDLNGSFKYSRTVTVRFENHTSVNLRPTLLSKGDPISIVVAGAASNKYRVNIVNMAGQLIDVRTMNGSNLQIETGNLNAGAYFINIEGAAIKKTFKVFIQ